MPSKFEEKIESAPAPDRIEMEKNREVHEALELLRKIEEELDKEGFTWQEVNEAFNAFTSVDNQAKRKYDKRHLDWLIKNGFLDYDMKTKQYRVIRSSETLKTPEETDNPEKEDKSIEDIIGKEEE